MGIGKYAGLATLGALWAAGCAKGGAPAPSVAPGGWFEDVTPKTAVRDYAFRIEGDRPLSLLQTIGNGCALADFNGDGALDLLLVGTPVALFVGDGKGGFSAAPAGAVPATARPVQGCAVGDVDNDGDPDVYLYGYRSGALWRNDGGRLIDTGGASGIPAQPWGTSAAFGDLDRDGRLDLVVANYVRFGKDLGTRTLCDFQGAAGKTVLAACGPREYVPLTAKVFRNLGSGRFADVTAASGCVTNGRGLGIAIVDAGLDGKPRVAIANDEAPGDLLVVERANPLRVANIGARSGTSYDVDGKLHGGMGVDWGDYDNDGKLDLAVATFESEPMSLYHADGADLFEDHAARMGVAEPTRPLVTFGLRFVDVDNDGWLDLVTTNGHVMDNVDEIKPTVAYRQPSQLLRNVGGTRFEEASLAAGGAFTEPRVGRGLASGDIDNDGRSDLVLIDSEGGAHILLNRHPTPGAWVGLRLIGTRSPRDGSGAIVTVRSGGRTLVRHAHADGSYLSASDLRVLVGLGVARGTADIEVLWPSGAKQRVAGVRIGAYTEVREPDR